MEDEAEIEETQETQEGGGEFHFEPVDEDMEDLEKVLRTPKDGLIIAIDCRKNMFKPYPESGKTPWSFAMSIIGSYMRKKVITGGKCLMGVLLYGTRESQNQNKFANIYDWMPLDLPSSNKIEQVDNYSDFNEKAKQLFQEKIGSQDDASSSGGIVIENLLWLCSLYFAEQKFTKNDSQRIWIFSNDENPCKSHPETRQKCLVRAKDLEKANQQLFLWPMKKKEDRTFNLNVFWKDMLAQQTLVDGEEVLIDDNEDHDRVIYVTSEEDLKDIMDNTRKKEFPKRTLASFPLILGANVELGVKMYAIVLETKMPSPIQSEAATGKPLKISTRWICMDTTEYLSPDQIVYVAKYGPIAKVPFSSEDKKRIKRFAPAGISILGFKPMKDLPDWQNVRAPYLLRPDDQTVRGSSKAFVALLGEVLDKKLYAVARLITNKSAAPKLCALVPQEEVLDSETNEVVVPMGFLVIVLPFADDIRVPSFPEPFAEATPEQVDLAKKIVEELSSQTNSKFDPRDYENPALQKFWSQLESLALDKRDETNRWKESENDLLRLPNEEDLVFNQNFVDAAKEFEESYGGAGEVETKKKSTPRKRKNDDDDDEKPARKKGSTSRKRKDEDDMDEEELDDEKPSKKKSAKVDPADVDWKELANSGKLEKMTNDDLKVYLKQHKIPQTGKKAELIEKIKAHLDKH